MQLDLKLDVARNLLVPALVGGFAGVIGALALRPEDSHSTSSGADTLSRHTGPNELDLPVWPDQRQAVRGPAQEQPVMTAATDQTRPGPDVDPWPGRAGLEEPSPEEVHAQRQQRYEEPFLAERRDPVWSGAAERTLFSSFHDYVAGDGGLAPGLEIRELECRESRCLARLRMPDEEVHAERVRKAVARRQVFGTDPDSGNCPMHSLPTGEDGVWTIVFDCKQRRPQEEE